MTPPPTSVLSLPRARPGAGPGARLVGVVREAEGHEEGAQVGVAQAQGAVIAGVLGDLPRRVGGVGDDDLLGGDHDGAGVAVAFDIEGRTRAQGVRNFAPLHTLFRVPCSFFLPHELEEVDGGEVAGGVVQVHVLGAGVGGVDTAAVGAGVPVVDGGVVLHAGVGAL